MFNLENPFWNAIGKLCDLVLVNILFVIGCLPVLTAGASLAALYTAVRKIIHDEGSSAIKEFLKAFRRYGKSATLLWLVLLPAGLLTVYEMYWMTLLPDSALTILKYVFFTLLVVWSMVTSYAFPVLSYYGEGLKQTAKRALVLSFYHLLPWTAVIVALHCLPVLLFLALAEQRLLLLQILCWIGFAAVAGINTLIFEKIFAVHEKQETCKEI